MERKCNKIYCISILSIVIIFIYNFFFKDFIKEKHKVNNLVSEFYQNKLFRKLKFRTQIYLRKSEDKFLNNI